MTLRFILTRILFYVIISVVERPMGTITVAVASRFTGMQISFAFPMRGGDANVFND